jgi:bacterioferritin-associated ferredoxin
MLVCHCLAVRSREIEDVIARGARTTAEIARHCGAGGRCGGCEPAIAELLERHADSIGAQNLRAEPSACAHNGVRI